VACRSDTVGDLLLFYVDEDEVSVMRVNVFTQVPPPFVKGIAPISDSFFNGLSLYAFFLNFPNCA
jgi:hypothetical protein